MGNEIGDRWNNERWAGGAWVSEEEYQKLLESGDIARGQPEFQAIKENLIDATGKVWNAASGAWEENVGKHIPDVDVELNKQTKEVLSTTKDVAGHVYNWTARSTVESAARGAGHVGYLLDIPIQGAHWLSKKVDPTGRGVGTGPLGIAEFLATGGFGSIAKGGGKALLKNVDEVIAPAAKALRGRQLAYEAIPVSPNVFNTKPLTTTNPMGIEGLSNVFQAKAVAKGSASVIPSATSGNIHNLTSETQSDWIENTLKPWILKNKSKIKANKRFTNENIGEIILDNQSKRVSTSGVQKFLDTGDTKHLVLKDSTAGKISKRALAADPVSSPVAMQSLETANQAWLQGTKTATGKRAGVNPEFLNPKTYRAGQVRGANFARQIFNKMRKIPGFEKFGIEQGHLVDLIESGGVDAMRGFGPETSIANKFWNRLEFGGTVINREAAEVLGISPGTWKEKAEAITSKGPLALQRKAEYEQFGVLSEIWDQALLASNTKGKSMKEAIATITEYRNQITKGDISSLQGSFKIPGSFVTIDDMLEIQILSLKGMNPAKAAEKVVAERLAWELAIEAGAANNHSTLKTLAQQMEHINTEIAVRKAVEKGAPKKGWRFTGKTLEEQTEWAKTKPGKYQVLESQATGK